MNSFNTPPTGGADIPDLSRVTFFDGQRLAAGDLNDAATVQREFRWLHNRSLHNWGIGLGLAVTGKKDDTQVQVGPGYAIDCRGREIVLTEPITKAVPARAGDSQGNPIIYFLVAAYPDDQALPVIEQRQGECGTDGAVRLQERAAIYWKAQGEQTVEQGVEIVLAQATVQNCRLAAPLSLDQRRTARPNQQPYVAAGATPAGGTEWTVRSTEVDGEPVVFGVTAEVDTAGGRFGTTPQYQAQVRGDRLLRHVEVREGQPFVLEGMTFVSAPRVNAFTIDVLLPRDLFTFSQVPVNPPELLDNPDLLRQIVQAHWSVVWVGVEG